MKKNFSIDMNSGILGNLYSLLNSYNVITKAKKFVELLTDIQSSTNNNLWSNIKYYDYFPAGPYSQICNKLNNKKLFLAEIEKYTARISPSLQREINFYLPLIIKEVTNYNTGGCYARNAQTKRYSDSEKSKLISYYSIKTTEFSLSYNIYQMIYFAVKKELSPDFFFGQAYQEDKKKFTEQVLCRYGVISDPGMREIYELAEKGNIFALYEYSDMMYYGKNDTKTVNHQKAFDYLERCAGVTCPTSSEKERCNPLALWSLSFIYYNYVPNPAIATHHILQLEQLERNSRIETAIRYAKAAYALNSCPPALNMLGVISLNEGAEVREKYGLLMPYEYFSNAADEGYVYSYNRMALMDATAIFTDPQNKVAHLKNYINHLTKAADKFENWASNRLGCFYLNGEVFCFIDGKRYSETFPDYSNRHAAYKYFKASFSNIIDSNSAWGYANMIIYFRSTNLCDSDITEYVNMIKHLNMPNVIEYLHENLPEDLITRYLT